MSEPARVTPLGRTTPVWFWWVIGLGAVWVILFAGSLSLIQIDRVNATSGDANLASLWPYWVCFTALWAWLSFMAWWLASPRSSGGVGPVSVRVHIGVILTVAAAGRIMAVIGSSPQLSDDLWRYIHDGRRLTQGANPYTATPQELGAGDGTDQILDQINHPHLVTIYLPTSQYVFAALWWLHPEHVDPLGDATFRLGFALLDLGVVVLLLVRLLTEGRSAWWAALYAWHPLAISEIAGSGHQDVVGVALLLVSLLLIDRLNGSWRRAIGGGAAMAAAAAVKPIILPITLPMAWKMRHHRWALGVSAASSVIMGMLLLVPMCLLGGGMARLLDTAQTFVSTWAYNSPLHTPLRWVTGSKSLTDLIMVGVVLAVVFRCMARGLDLWRTAGWVLFVLLWVSSTVHPWYLLWALPFVALRFNPAVWVWSLTISFSYAVLGDVAHWRLPIGVTVWEYAPVCAALGWSWITSTRGSNTLAHRSR